MATTNKPFRHMKAATLEAGLLERLPYPLLGSVKIDGYRTAVMHETNTPVSTRILPLANKPARQFLSRAIFAGIDAEITVGDPKSMDVARLTTSAMNAHARETPFDVWVFDYYNPYAEAHQDTPYQQRMSVAHELKLIWPDNVHIIEQVPIKNARQLVLHYERCLDEGWEGGMYRRPDGQYKFGRSTINESWLLKYKPTVDSEAIVLEVLEEMHNANEAVRDARGLLKRTTHKANKIGKGRMGRIRAADIHTGIEFYMAGFDDKTKEEWWGNPPLGLLVKYTMMGSGMKDKPRQGRFKEIRSPNDLDPKAHKNYLDLRKKYGLSNRNYYVRSK